VAQILRTEIVSRRANNVYAVFTVASGSNPDKTYRVDVTNGRCDCPGWKFQRAPRRPCKHLRQFGYSEQTQIAMPVQSTAKGASPKIDYSKEL